MVKEVLRELIAELVDHLGLLASASVYGSLKEYTEFLTRIITGFAELLLSEREEPTPQEWVLLRELSDNPMLRPLAIKAKIEGLF